MHVINDLAVKGHVKKQTVILTTRVLATMAISATPANVSSDRLTLLISVINAYHKYSKALESLYVKVLNCLMLTIL
jgi:hypothetical protein